MATVPFRIKYFDQAVASMLNWMASVQSDVTDFNVGSVNRTLLESVAMEFEEFYFRMVDALEQAIPDSAYESFDFARAAATTATGKVTFSRSTPADQDYVIPAGTIVSTDELVTFATVEAVTLLTGTTSIAADIIATKSGVAGNVQAASITVLNGAILGIEAVTNAAATTGGTAAETDEERAVRFRVFVEALPRTTVGGLEGGAMTAKIVEGGAVKERVRLAKVVAPYLTGDGPRGVVEVYIDNGAGVASAALVTEAQKILDGYLEGGTAVVGYVAAGVTANVQSVVGIPVNVTATITPKAGAVLATVQQAVRDAVSQYFAGLRIHDSLDWERLLATVITALDVETATVTVPSADLTTNVGERIILGTVTVL